MLRSHARIRRTTIAVATAAVLTGTVTAAATATASTRLPTPPPTPRESAAIEDFASYQPQFFCRSTVEPGVRAFEKLVLRTYPMTHSLGDARACSVAGTSEHKDGRAWDWGADHRVARQRAAGQSMLQWLFATDRFGNRDAMFRRLGLMYVIWNKRIWGAWDQHWEPYSCSGVTGCHVNHMHFSFGWAGAEKKTSYWTDQVKGAIEPPLPKLDRMHAHRIVNVTNGDEVTALWLVVPSAAYRVTATGTLRHAGTAKADAGCVKTPSGWRSAKTVSVGGDQLQLWGVHWQPTVDTGNGCNTKTHTYRLTLRPGLLSTVTADVSAPRDSTGRIRLRFVRTS